MALPIILGWSDKIERTGPTFQAECPACLRVQRFYEAKKKFNVTAFFSVSLWDSEEPVVQCAHCQQCFEPDDVTAVSVGAPPSLRARVVDALGLDKPASAKGEPAKVAPAPAKALPSKAEVKQREDEELEAELAAMKKRVKR